MYLLYVYVPHVCHLFSQDLCILEYVIIDKGSSPDPHQLHVYFPSSSFLKYYFIPHTKSLFPIIFIDLLYYKRSKHLKKHPIPLILSSHVYHHRTMTPPCGTK